MRISDWSSDVCSSDLKLRVAQAELDRMRSDAQFFAEQIAQIEQRANWLRAILPRDRQLAALREQADEIRDAIASAEASISNMLATPPDGPQLGHAKDGSATCREGVS